MIDDSFNWVIVVCACIPLLVLGAVLASKMLNPETKNTAILSLFVCIFVFGLLSMANNIEIKEIPTNFRENVNKVANDLPIPLPPLPYDGR